MPQRAGAWVRTSVTLKLLSIALLLALLLIRSSMVESLITERAANRDAATAEISAQWGGAQMLLGPVLGYSLVFGVLQLQDCALLVGSGGLVAVLVKYLARNVDWYGAEIVGPGPPPG